MSIYTHKLSVHNKTLSQTILDIYSLLHLIKIKQYVIKIAQQHLIKQKIFVFI